MKRSLEQATDSVYSIDTLPLDVLFKIVYQVLDSLLSVFAVNRALHAMQNLKGFWPGLLRIAFPGHALKLLLFLREAPEITRLDIDAVTDLLVLTARFDSSDIARQARVRHKYELVVLGKIQPLMPLFEIEHRLLVKGDLNVLDRLYVIQTMSDGTVYEAGRFPIDVKTEHSTIKLTVRHYLLRYYRLMIDAQTRLTYKELLESIFVTAARIKSMPRVFIDEVQLLRLFKNTIKVLADDSLPRIRAYAVLMQRVKEEFEREIKLAMTPDLATGKLPTYETLYLPTLETQFQSYFGLDDEETASHMKKLFARIQQKYAKTVLVEGLTLCL